MIFRSASSASGFNNTWTDEQFAVPKPAGAQVGDLVAVGLQSQFLTEMREENGWRVLKKEGFAWTTQVWYKVLDGTEPNPLIFRPDEGWSQPRSWCAGAIAIDPEGSGVDFLGESYASQGSVLASAPGQTNFLVQDVRPPSTLAGIQITFAGLYKLSWNADYPDTDGLSAWTDGSPAHASATKRFTKYRARTGLDNYYDRATLLVGWTKPINLASGNNVIWNSPLFYAFEPTYPNQRMAESSNFAVLSVLPTVRKKYGPGIRV